MDTLQEIQHKNGLNLFSSPKSSSKMAKPNMAEATKATVIMEARPSSPAVDQTTQTHEEDVPPTEIKHTAEILGNDVVNYFAKHDSNCPNKYSKYCKTLRRTADELSTRHEILFNGMVNKLKTFDRNSYDSFKGIIDEIFSDRQINWGRIVTVYTFGGKVAKYYYEHGQEVEAERVGEYLGSYVGNKLGRWIHRHGGWDAFVSYFPDPKEGENQVWTGLLYTALGLGALATTLVAVR